MPDYYLPIFRYQIGDPTTVRDAAICTMESGAMVLDYHTLGRLKLWGGQLEVHQTDHVGGTDLNDLKTAWAYYGEYLDVRSGQGWAAVKTALGEGRAVVLQGDEMGGTTTLDNCQPGFRGGHACCLIPSTQTWALTGDPLCKEFKAIPEATVKAFAQALNPRVQFAVSAAHPPLAVQPQESQVKVTATVYQKWTAVGTDGVLRATPARSAPVIARLPAGTEVISRAEADDPAGNHWRLIDYPKGSRNPAWLLRYGPGIPPDHDFKAGAIITDPVP